jgi:hypothetical protein
LQSIFNSKRLRLLIARKFLCPNLVFIGPSLSECSSHRGNHLRWAGDIKDRAAHDTHMLMQHLLRNVSRLALPFPKGLVYPGKCRNKSKSGIILFQLPELIKECGIFELTVRVEQNDR